NGAVVNWATTYADLEITKQDAPDPVALNGTLTYTIGVTNHGPDTAVGVQVVDTLPASVTFVNATAGCVNAFGTVTCSLGDLLNGASGSVTITVQPATSTIIQNTAQVFSSTADPLLTNNTAMELTTVSPAATSADLAIAIAHAPSTPVVGAPITYTLTVTNNGPSTATGIGLLAALDPSTTFVSVNNAACGESAGAVSCTFPTLASGAQIAVNIVTTPTASQLLLLAASVSSAVTDPTPANNQAQDTVFVS